MLYDKLQHIKYISMITSVIALYNAQRLASKNAIKCAISVFAVVAKSALKSLCQLRLHFVRNRLLIGPAVSWL